MADATHYPVLVVGAGPAGLATSRELCRRGVRHLVLERGDDVGHTWSNLYDSLRLHTGKHLSALPGLQFPRSTPLFPSRSDFLGYLRRYAATFDLPVVCGCDVSRARRDGDAWRLTTSRGAFTADHLVLATGIVANPRMPELPGCDRFGGRVLHSVAYRRPEPFAGRRVLIVGLGNSAGEIAAELAASGAAVTVAVRSGAHVVPRSLFGVPIQYIAYAVGMLPDPAERALLRAFAGVSRRLRGKPVLPPSPRPFGTDIPLIGFHLPEAVRAGAVRLKGDVVGFTAGGVRFRDGSAERFDDVIFATGYRPAVGLLASLVRTDARGFALRRDRVASVDQPGLYFVGHNYDATGGLHNIARDAPVAALAMHDALNARHCPSPS